MPPEIICDQTALRLPAASTTESWEIANEPVWVNGPTVAVNVDPDAENDNGVFTPLTSTVA